jgi:hypothetical protein
VTKLERKSLGFHKGRSNGKIQHNNNKFYLPIRKVLFLKKINFFQYDELIKESVMISSGSPLGKLPGNYPCLKNVLWGNSREKGRRLVGYVLGLLKTSATSRSCTPSPFNQPTLFPNTPAIS